MMRLTRTLALKYQGAKVDREMEAGDRRMPRLVRPIRNTSRARPWIVMTRKILSICGLIRLKMATVEIRSSPSMACGAKIP